MDFKNLSSQQLITIYNGVPNAREDVRKEWRKRFSLSFPYRLIITGTVTDGMKGLEVDDEQLPSYVLDQVNDLRKRLKVNL